MTNESNLEKNYRKYLSFSEKALHERLNKQRETMPELVRTEIIAQVAAEKKRLRSVNAQKRAHDATWREFMRPLIAELRSVVNMGRYISKSYKVPERTEAIIAYRTALEKLKRLLTRYRDQYESTPLRLAREKNVPNDGMHWVDWVPVRVRIDITALFDAIPHHYRAKIKTPFERRTMNDDNALKRRRLARKVEQELNRAYKDLANEPLEYDNADHHEYIARLNLATKAIIALSDEDYVPATWQGLFKV